MTMPSDDGLSIELHTAGGTNQRNIFLKEFNIFKSLNLVYSTLACTHSLRITFSNLHAEIFSLIPQITNIEMVFSFIIIFIIITNNYLMVLLLLVLHGFPTRPSFRPSASSRVWPCPSLRVSQVPRFDPLTFLSYLSIRFFRCLLSSWRSI